MVSKSFPVYKSIDIKPWCAKIEDAREVYPTLENYLDSNGQLDFGDPKALKIYNQAVAKVIADLEIQVPEEHLIPAVCLRYGYIKIVFDEFLSSDSTIIEVGTGASAIISLFAAKSFDISCVSTEINLDSYLAAENNISRNQVSHKITLIKSEGEILKGLIDPQVKYSAILTYPPTYGDNVQDLNKLNKKRGFQGVGTEMLGGGASGFEFTEQYLMEACSSDFDITTITVLCLFKSHVIPSISILEQNERTVRVYEIIAGTRKRYLVAGTRF